MSARLRQLVLDFDGVIADGTNRAYVAAYTDALRSVGCGLADRQIEAGILRRWGESPRRELAEVLGEDHPDLDTALGRYLECIDDRLLRDARPLPGALAAVERLAARYRLYLISGMGGNPLRRIVQGFGLAHHLAAVISTSDSDLPERQKSTGYHLQRLCSQRALDPAETLCVGDAASDIAMARRCGIAVAVVLTGALDRPAAIELGADWVLPALADLPDLLQEGGWPPANG